jgi:hypothetical protein
MRIDHFSSPNRTIDTVSWGHSWDGTGTKCTDRCGASWMTLGQNTHFSAVCKFTGAGLFDALKGKVPIGLVESAWGGTRIESWSSPDALKACPVDTTAGCGPGLGHVGQRMNSTNSGNLCSAAYNGMLHPILPMRLKAMIWYQGESNLDSFQGTWAGSRSYACRSRAAVADWRVKFDAPDLPVFYVELAACTNYDNAIVLFPLLRQAQRAVTSLPHTGYITAIDVGTKGGGVHSPTKIPDGERLTLQIRAKVYGETDIQADGPLLASAPVVAGPIVTLTYTQSSGVGMHALPVHATTLPDGCSQTPFEVGYSDGSWADANFTIDAAKYTVALAAPPAKSGVTITEVCCHLKASIYACTYSLDLRCVNTTHLITSTSSVVHVQCSRRCAIRGRASRSVCSTAVAPVVGMRPVLGPSRPLRSELLWLRAAPLPKQSVR